MPMQPLTSHTGTTAILRRSRVDTDQIIPVEFCRAFSRTGFAQGLFANWRKDPDFVLNDPLRATATVLVAGSDFGTGSSREPAVWALWDWGLRAVLAPSFGDIFHRNAWKNGLLAVTLPGPVIDGLMDLGERSADLEVSVDLAGTVVRWPGAEHPFEVNARARWLLRNGLDEIAVTLGQDEAISSYERGRAPWFPTFSPAAEG
jgi:3-isopropylmalate/(R)-2-methylmalate dehydratase small subunit